MSLKHDADNTLWLEQMVRAQASRIEQLEAEVRRYASEAVPSTSRCPRCGGNLTDASIICDACRGKMKYLVTFESDGIWCDAPEGFNSLAEAEDYTVELQTTLPLGIRMVI